MKLMTIVTLILSVTHFQCCLAYGIGNSSPDGWVSKMWEIPEEVSLTKRYLRVFKHSLRTLKGKGDIEPVLLYEKWFSIFVEIFGAIFFAVLVGMLGTLIKGRNATAKKLESQVSVIFK